MTRAEHDCRRCGRQFSSAKAFERHIRKVHGGSSGWTTSRLAAVGALALLVVGGVVALGWKASEPAAPLDLERDFSLTSSARLGDDEAPVKLFAFESPQCSSCRFFHVGTGSGPSTYDRIVENYVETGQVQYVEKTFYIGYPWERLGASAQKCVWHTQPESFHDLTTAIYENQFRIDGGNFHSFLAQWAASVGMDADALRQCVEEDRYTSEADRDSSQGRALGVRGTPTFVVVGPTGVAETIRGPQSYETFEAAFHHVLAQ